MAFGKDKSNYDATDSDTLAASDFVGSYTLGSDGTRITYTTVSAKKALDVYIANAITVDLDGIYNGVSNLDPDNVGLIGHTRAASPGDSDQVERITVGAASADDLVAANIHGLDSISFLHGFDGTTWDRLRTVSGTLHVGDIANTAIESTQKDVSVTGAVLASQLSNRKYYFQQNLGSKNIYVGKSGVTIANGFRVGVNSAVELRLGPALVLHAVSQDGNAQDNRVMELS